MLILSAFDPAQAPNSEQEQGLPEIRAALGEAPRHSPPGSRLRFFSQGGGLGD